MPCRRKLISEAKIERRSIYAAYTERKGIAKGSQRTGEARVEKYLQHAAAAKDEQLSQLLTYLGGIEQGHLDTVTKIDNGEIPKPAAGETAPKNDFKQTYSVSETPEKKNDCYICSDLLATEKHASALYDTCIFEFKNEQLRTVLNSIQREEQEHGKKIYDYMAANNMYS